jgi:hypothetical protein
LDLTAGPFEWGPIIGGEGVRSKTSIPRVPYQPSWKDSTLEEEEEHEEENKGESTLAVQMERYRSESAFLDAYWSKLCQTSEEGGATEKSSLCNDLERQIANIRSAIASLEAQGTTNFATTTAATLLAGGPHEGANATQLTDDFMSKLGATVSN